MRSVRNISILLSLLALFIVVSCRSYDGREDSEHVPNYSHLRCRVESCDTVGLMSEVCRVRDTYGNVQKSKVKSYRDVDADILLAWSYCLYSNSDSSCYYAYRALDGLRQLKDTTTNEWLSDAADMEYILAVMYSSQQETDSSFAHLRRSLDLARRSSRNHQVAQLAVNDRMRDEAAAREEDGLSERRVAQNEPLADNNDWYWVLVFVVCAALFFIQKWRNKRAASSTAEYNELLRAELNSKLAELQRQADMIETTNMRISESITYAEHIQHSMMPSPEDLNNYPISGSFVFHNPLDIVSGDFLWFTRKNDYLIICCADCTGHGVPGAFMSMIASTIINDICDRIVGNNVDPAAMLERLDHSLVENLAHNRSESGDAKDGLDISIVALNLVTHQLITSSARRPVVVFKNDEMIVVRGTKRSIGDLEPNICMRCFENSTFQLSEGDKFYLYTDGYSDQFGGQQGSKMKKNRIENFLNTIHRDDMDEQLLSIQELFTQWKGDFPQTDDVLFVGVCV